MTTAVVFDVGETILDPSRIWAAWAAFFEVPPHTFSAVFGAMISRGAGVQAVVESFGDGASYPELLARRGPIAPIVEVDLYPDVRACLAELRRQGLAIGIAGNQPAAVAAELRGLSLDVDFVAASAEWQVSKPDSRFFARVAAEVGAPAAEIVYVGDQLGNDITAALNAGFKAVRILRGPWGRLLRDADIEARCLAVITSLTDLPAAAAQ